MSNTQLNSPKPIDIKLHQKSRLLEIVFDDNTECMLSCEFLRVYSPSAEVRGHGAGQEVLQTGKEDVNIVGIEPVGNYAVKLIFSDGHDTGLYSWDYLHNLASNYESLWLEYVAKLECLRNIKLKIQACQTTNRRILDFKQSTKTTRPAKSARYFTLSRKNMTS
jgi:DUF971 family protein